MSTLVAYFSGADQNYGHGGIVDLRRSYPAVNVTEGLSVRGTDAKFSTRKAERIAQNTAAGDVILSPDEIARIDTALDGMDFEVFGGNAAARSKGASDGRHRCQVVHAARRSLYHSMTAREYSA